MTGAGERSTHLCLHAHTCHHAHARMHPSSQLMLRYDIYPLPYLRSSGPFFALSMRHSRRRVVRTGAQNWALCGSSGHLRSLEHASGVMERGKGYLDIYVSANKHEPKERQTGRQADRQTDKRRNVSANKHVSKDVSANKHVCICKQACTERKTDRQAGRQAGRRTNVVHPEKQTYM